MKRDSSRDRKKDDPTANGDETERSHSDGEFLENVNHGMRRLR
ncbi:MAG: hypothetical protein R3231_08585 [bacterium]|nr:hypothetical protein [bacterium]